MTSLLHSLAATIAAQISLTARNDRLWRQVQEERAKTWERFPQRCRCGTPMIQALFANEYHLIGDLFCPACEHQSHIERLRSLQAATANNYLKWRPGALLRASTTEAQRLLLASLPPVYPRPAIPEPPAHADRAALFADLQTEVWEETQEEQEQEEQERPAVSPSRALLPAQRETREIKAITAEILLEEVIQESRKPRP